MRDYFQLVCQLALYQNQANPKWGRFHKTFLGLCQSRITILTKCRSELAKSMTRGPPMRTNLSGCFSSCSPPSAQHRWSSQDGCLVICHTHNLQHFAVEKCRRGVGGLSVWCSVAIITRVSPRVNSLTRCATHLPHLHICGKDFNLKGNLNTHTKEKLTNFSLVEQMITGIPPRIPLHQPTRLSYLWKTLPMEKKYKNTHMKNTIGWQS